MSLVDKVREAYEKAQTSLDPVDWRVYNALDAWLRTVGRPQPEPSAPTVGIPDPPVSRLAIPRGPLQN